MMDKFDHLDTFIRPQQAWELLGMKKTAFYAKVKSRAAGFPNPKSRTGWLYNQPVPYFLRVAAR